MTRPDPASGGRVGATVVPTAADEPAQTPSVPIPPVASLYVVAAHVPRHETLAVGALGTVHLERGWYAYVGSARRGRGARVARHRRTDKPLRWHADYLFARHAASLAWTFDLAPAALGQPAECLLAGALLGCESRARQGPPRFGASDCVCAGHLLWFPSRTALLGAVTVVARADWTRQAAPLP